MKKLLGFVLITVVVLAACNNQDTKTNTAENKQLQVEPNKEFVKLNEYLRKFEEPSQMFKVSTDKPIKVVGKLGTVIRINPSDLETENGQAIDKEIDIELEEVSTQQGLVRGNAQTVSDGQLLVSGGAYFINATSKGQKVKMKEGKTYAVEFPKLAEDEMDLYYGQRDSSGTLNWKKADQKFTSKKEVTKPGLTANIVLEKSISKDTIKVAMDKSRKEVQKMVQSVNMSNKVYQPIPLNLFGWINCDRLFPQNGLFTSLQFTIANKVEEVNYVNVYLIFDDIKSMMQASYFVQDNKIAGNTFINVPVGRKVKFFAVCYQHDKIYALLTNNIQVLNNHTEKLMLKEMNETDFDKLLTTLN